MISVEILDDESAAEPFQHAQRTKVHRAVVGPIISVWIRLY